MIAPADLLSPLTGPEAAAVYRPARLAEIVRLGLDRPEADAVLRAAVREATSAFDLPIGLVSIVLDDAQHFLASEGLHGWLAETLGTPVEWSFCRFAVAEQRPFVVEDATTHPLVRDNPLVTIDGIRCYAGAPLVTSRGEAVGSLCVIGTEPRAFGALDVARLQALAADVVRYLEERAQ